MLAHVIVVYPLDSTPARAKIRTLCPNRLSKRIKTSIQETLLETLNIYSKKRRGANAGLEQYYPKQETRNIAYMN